MSVVQEVDTPACIAAQKADLLALALGPNTPPPPTLFSSLKHMSKKIKAPPAPRKTWSFPPVE